MLKTRVLNAVARTAIIIKPRNARSVIIGVILNENKLISVIVPTFNRQTELEKCLASIGYSDYLYVESIVVDNNEVNRGAAGGRNFGAKQAKGNYLLFVDDDNIVDRKMISHLVKFFKEHQDCVMAGPLMFYKDNPLKIWLCGCRINMLTSQAEYQGTGFRQEDGEYYLKVGHLPNCFMVRREDFEAVGGFDEKYIIMYEEADFAHRLKRKLKGNIYIYSKAKIYHNISQDKKPYIFESKERAYLVGRNRVYFMRKNAGALRFLIFIFIFLPIVVLIYEFNLLKGGHFKMAGCFLAGTLRGFIL